MGEEISKFSEGRRLNTWKEIASYFGRDERTVKRWEASRSLPVRRMPKGPRSVVFAYERDLAVWRDGAASSEPADNDGSGTPGWKTETSHNAPPPIPATGRKWWLIAGVGSAVAVVISVWALSGFLVEHRQNAGLPATNREAASFYQTGVYEWQTRTPEGLLHAVDDFTQSIVHDPGFAPAYAGLAMCFNLLREYTTMAPEDAYPKAKAAAERAISLDPSLANAHAALAFVEFYWSRDSGAANREFRRALALAPRDPITHQWFATMLMEIGDFDGATREIEKAESLDSESTAIRADKGLILYFSGRKSEAITLLERLEQAQPAFASTHRYLAWMFLWRGDDTGYLNELEATANLRHDAAEAQVALAGRHGLIKGGHRGMLTAELAAQQRLWSRRQTSAYALAITFAALGDTQGAFEFLRRSIKQREAEEIGLGIDPSFDALRGQAEFRKLAASASALQRS